MPCEACDPPFSATIVECYFFFQMQIIMFFSLVLFDHKTKPIFHSRKTMKLSLRQPLQLSSFIIVPGKLIVVQFESILLVSCETIRVEYCLLIMFIL